MKKKVLFFIESLQCGGAEKSLISLFPLLDYSKMDVDLLLLQRGGVFEQYVPECVHIITFDQQVQSWMFRIFQVLFSLRLRWNRLIGRKEHGAETRWRTMHRAYTPIMKHYDVAIAYQQGLPTYYIIDKVSADKKIAWANVDLTKAGYSAIYNKVYYSCYDTVVAVAANLKDMLVAENFVQLDKVMVIQDILNVALIREMAIAVPQYSVQTGKLKLVTVGRMVYQKGYDIAVEVANKLRNSGLDFLWYFVGDGAAREQVTSLIREKNLSDHIILCGEQANPYPYMAAADIYVQTSRFEGFGITISEAKILHKPIVSTNFPVVFNQLTDRKNGIVAEMNADDIAQKIMQLVASQDLRSSIVCELRKEKNLTAREQSLKVNQLIVN